MSWSARPSEPAGHVVTAVEMTAILDQIDLLTAPPLVQLRQTTLQSIPNAAGTALTFTTEDIDSVNGHDNVTNNTRYTIQAGYAGQWQLSGGVGFASNATNRRGCWWVINGTVVNGSESVMAAGSNIVSVVARVIAVSLAVGDFIELQAFQDSGGALNTAVTTTQQPSLTARLVYQ